MGNRAPVQLCEAYVAEMRKSVDVDVLREKMAAVRSEFVAAQTMHQHCALESGSLVTPGLSAMGGTRDIPGSLKTPGQSLIGETAGTIPGLLIDWLTLRIPLEAVGEAVAAKVRSCLGLVVCTDSDGVVKWQKRQLDVEKLRSDSAGLYWAAQGDGNADYLVVAGSPASLRQGLNVFGDLDIVSGAEIIRGAAMKALAAYLPHVEFWQCRRIDITGNYGLPDRGAVKQALRQLLNTDGVRRKASSAKKGGDSVYWAPTSDISKGKAYHKGEQLRMLLRRGRLEGGALTAQQLDDADRLLRLEHTRGARWFRRFEQAGGKWWHLGVAALQHLYIEFFGPLVGGLEVKDMGREQIVRTIEREAHCTHQAALQAFNTYRNIKVDGFEETRAGMARRTWFRHLKILRAAGFSDAQLCAGNVIPFQTIKVLLAVPVASWGDLRAA